jgi:tellurite resistance protein
LQLGLGQLIADGKPIPVDWALAWLRLDPEIPLRTPATRCPDEFAELFGRHYSDRYGRGLLVKTKRSALAGAYTPASAGFAGQVVRVRTGLPDVTVLSEPVAQLRNVAEQACAELDAYSRYLGRHPEAIGTAAALALLPAGIDRPADAATAALLTWADDNLGDSDQVDVAGAELLARWPATVSGRIAKSDAVPLIRLLERSGVGLEPDVRFGGPVPTGHMRLVLFRHVTEAESVPRESYGAGAAVAELAAVVAAADGSVSALERDLLVREVTAVFGLADEEQRRLRAHLAFVLTQPPTAAALRKHAALLTDAQRRDAGELLAAIAVADGTVSQPEIDSLGRQFTLLGLDPAMAYGSVQAVGAISGDTLTWLRTAGAPGPSYAIPQPLQPQPDHRSTAVFLDPQLVKQRLADSDRVATYLAELFADEEEAADGQSLDSSAAGPDQGSAGVAGLDPAHSTLLRRLAQRPQWTRQEFDNIAAEFGLLPDGAWETLNEASVDASGEPVCEGVDPVQLNSYALEEMLR